MKDVVAPLVIVALVLISGCVGSGGQTQATTDYSTPTAATGTATEPTTDGPAKGTQFVSVEQLDNQSAYTKWPEHQSVTFENLSSAQQRVFENALDGKLTVRPSEDNPFSAYDSDRPEVVRYRGTWYYVRVSIV